MKILLLVLIAYSPFAFAESGWVLKGKLFHGKEVAQTVQYYQGPNARLEMAEGVHLKPKSWLTYQSGRISVVDPKQKSVVQFDEHDLQRVAALLPAPRQQATFSPTGKPRKVGQWQCQPHSVVVTGKKHGEVCILPYKRAGIDPATLNPLRSLGQSLASLGPLMGAWVGGQQTPFATWGLHKVLDLGLVVEATALNEKGQPDWRMVIESISKQNIAPALFSPPPDFVQNNLGSMLKSLNVGPRK